MSDTGVRGRVRGLLRVPATEQPYAQSMEQVPMENSPDQPVQHQALQVLTLAQRTAEDHLSRARHEAEQICEQAREAAGQIAREAQAHAEGVRREAAQVQADAQAAAAQIVHEAQAHADDVRQEAGEILAQAQARADEFVDSAQRKADELQQLAQQRYDDVVGSLAARRESLQQQIEALERFDREYRARLQAFMQNQLRALWVEEPEVDPTQFEAPDSAAAIATVPMPREEAERSLAHTS